MQELKGLLGEVLCFTGTMSKTRAECTKLAEKAGAEVKKTVTKAVTVLVEASGKGGAKAASAGKDVRVINEAQFLKLASAGADDDDDDDDESGSESESDEPVQAKSKSGKSAKSTKSEKSTKGGEGKVKLIKKGKGVVDVLSGKASTHHVVEHGGSIYQAMLNQTNLVGANNNKFYVVQLLEADVGGGFIVFTRWGRVGVPGSTGFAHFSNVASGIHEFCKKFRDKTKNDWMSLIGKPDNFVKHSGKYQLMDIDVGNDDEEDDDEDEAAPTSKPTNFTCKLEKRVKGVMSLIADKSQMIQTLKELEVNTEQMPLGKISKGQIKAANKVLQQIDEKLTAHKTSGLAELSAQFYTLVPHDFGMCKPTVLKTTGLLKQKMQLLDAMADIEIANKIITDGKASKTKHPLDAAYDALRCKIEPLDKDSDEYADIVQYCNKTKGSTHTQYKLEVLDVFSLEREGEEKRFKKHVDDENRQLLWHGSGVSNWCGILSQGLRIAPPEAPVTGYMFGKGVYFADCSTKSANYCRPSKQNPVAFMTLNEVSLGKMNELKQAQYMDQAPKGTMSTKGLGKYGPAGVKEDANGMKWPQGPLKDLSSKIQSSLLYNEYIVYNVDQVKARYMVQVRFNY